MALEIKSENVSDSLALSKKILDNRDKLFSNSSLSKGIEATKQRHEAYARELMFPIGLGVYDGDVAERDLNAIIDAIKLKGGFANARRLDQIPNLTEIENNVKFKILIKKIKEEGGYAFPIIYVHPAMEQGKGLGLVNEIRDILDSFPDSLLLMSLVLVSNGCKSPFEHLSYFPNSATVNGYGQASKVAIEYLKRHLKWVRYKQVVDSCKTEKNNR